MSVKPSLPKGTRDLLPQAMHRREFIANIIREVFANTAMLRLNPSHGKAGNPYREVW
ncbi:MAG: hypothetical protein U5L96_04645 [Owenweeksia sp.]|nr:hypothetical protein [Owenweeksia sp.]